MRVRSSFSGAHLRSVLAAWLPAIAWATLIFILSSQPNLRFVPDAGLDFVVRKIGHLGVFGILALLLWRALAAASPWRRPWAGAFVLAVLYAATDEVHQGFVPGRHLSVLDVGIDAAGTLIALVSVGLLRSRQSRSREAPAIGRRCNHGPHPVRGPRRDDTRR